MIVVGLAGRAGCGKSAVARRLSERDDVVWVDLDPVAWTTYAPGTATHRALVERFGIGIVAEDGSIDRRRLADAVFVDEGAAADLDRLVHPAVVRALESIRAEEEKRGTRVLLVEGALLASSDAVDRSTFDVIVWMDVDETVRRTRLRAAGRLDHAERSDRLRPAPGVLQVDAAGSIDTVSQRLWTLVENLEREIR